MAQTFRVRAAGDPIGDGCRGGFGGLRCAYPPYVYVTVIYQRPVTVMTDASFLRRILDYRSRTTRMLMVL